MNLSETKEIRAAAKWLRKQWPSRSQNALTHDLVTEYMKSNGCGSWFELAVAANKRWHAAARRRAFKSLSFGMRYSGMGGQHFEQMLVSVLSR